jgi:hypothetical protein
VVDSSQDWDARQRTLMRDPKYREARREQERLKLAQRRANLIRLLGFSPEQADATIDLDIDQQFRWDEEYAARRSSEETRQDVVRARADAIEREHQDKLRALLGEEKSLRLQAYMESRQSRMQVDNLRSELNEANALRDDQVEPLIAALHVERAQMKSELKEYRDTLIWDGDNTEHWQRYSERSIELMKAMNSRMLTSASSLLTQAQLDALEKNLREDLAQAEAQQRMNRIQSKLDLANQSTATPN